MSAGKNRWVIFDADNTLWSVEHLYDDARKEICDFLQPKVDPHAADQFQRNRDKELYQTYGYSACRFARSFEDTLLHFVADAPAKDVRHVRRLALDVFEKRTKLADGVEDVLRQISSVYQMGIITAGERWVQERRLADFHLTPLFAAIEIVESKNEAVFRGFAESRGIDRDSSWVVGDSYRSDIRPAKAAGFRAILVNAHNWTIEDEEVTVQPDAKIATLQDLTKVPGLIPPEDSRS